jgi:predicted ATPase
MNQSDARLFSGLRLAGWRQFADLDIRFHPKLTVLTGANGAGKTTLLNILNRHFGWNLQFVGSLKQQRRMRKAYRTLWGEGDGRAELATGEREVGLLDYSDGSRSMLIEPPQDHIRPSQYQLRIPSQREVAGVFIASHRAPFFFSAVESVPTQLSTAEQLLNQYVEDLRSRYLVNHSVRSPSHRLKEALISLAFGFGNEVMSPDPEAISIYRGFEKILRTVLPPKLGFKRIEPHMPDVYLATATGDFSLDAVSGGIAAIIDLAWQVYMYSLNHTRFVVVVDEPENHLHPELQKSLLPNFTTAFPGIQFIVATHNPLIIGSVPESSVYVLSFGDGGAVYSHLLEAVNKAGTSNELLRDALGMGVTMPLWAEQRLREIVDRYRGRRTDPSALLELRDELSELGLDDSLPHAVGALWGDEID